MVFEAVTELEKHRREQANIDARIHAIGWSGLFNGFKDKNDLSIDFVELLPFSDEAKSQSGKISDKTKDVILKAIKEKSLPSTTLATLSMLVVT